MTLLMEKNDMGYFAQIRQKANTQAQFEGVNPSMFEAKPHIAKYNGSVLQLLLKNPTSFKYTRNDSMNANLCFNYFLTNMLTNSLARVKTGSAHPPIFITNRYEAGHRVVFPRIANILNNKQPSKFLLVSLSGLHMGGIKQHLSALDSKSKLK